jgi:hypothetical protein
VLRHRAAGSQRSAVVRGELRQEFLDPQERPNREDLAAQHNVFVDSMLEPVPLPRWLRGRKRAPRDKLS